MEGAISTITDAVCDAVLEWQHRPLEAFYPVIYLDAIRIKIRRDHTVENRAAHLAVGVDMEGIKHVLGIWVQPMKARLLGPRVRRSGQPGRARCPDRVLRRIGWPARSHRSDLAPVHGPNLRRSLNPRVHAFRVLQGTAKASQPLSRPRTARPTKKPPERR